MLQMDTLRMFGISERRERAGLGSGAGLLPAACGGYWDASCEERLSEVHLLSAFPRFVPQFQGPFQLMNEHEQVREVTDTELPSSPPKILVSRVIR
jgi:hypothetical protein